MSILPDVLEPGLKVVFCGTAAGNRSEELTAYYAGHNNQFYATLHEIELTPEELRPQEFRDLAKFKIGLTDLAQQLHGMDHMLKSADFDREAFEQKIQEFKPKAVAFNGKKAAQVYFKTDDLDYGRQSKMIGNTVVFVLPST